MSRSKPGNKSVPWCAVLTGVVLLVIWSTACPAEQRTYMEAKLYGFVKYKGDLSHRVWNPKNQPVIYKSFESPYVQIAFTG
jgi:hypothetical protein